ncbi:hypothetical protein BGZ96_000956 [Linnemannia gamsii]|uniref:dolichyl-phosphate-mannose--protein mannosyltransferase n=1 Tax=Linnemannia gamsii TaxID=64522 RepID=A0ABQ7JN21_9FUNG|nr:hypothetical protein BGZ96_000956 [Linnemannia gamsii]
MDHESPPSSSTKANQQPSSSEKNKRLSPAVIVRQSRQSQTREMESDDLWSWITATHISIPSHSSLPPTVNSKQQQPEQDVDGTQGEEKKQAKSSWCEIQRQYALRFRGRDWATLSTLTVATMSVRLWRMGASPGEVVLDEAHVGKYVNGYLKKEFTYDIHPPLGKMLLAGISSLAGKYDGSFAFDEVGDAYGEKVPFLAMRTAMAVMGALCAPIAYITLRNKGQGAPTAILASVLIALDNALVANNRFISLEAPLMFFTALSFMSWTLFTKQAQSPFGVRWWLWLMMTGLAASGAMSTKLPGVLTVLTMGILAGWDLWGLITDETVSTTQWVKHCISRMTTLAVIPVVVYTSIYYLHFQLQTNQPYYATSVHGDYDLTLLTPAFRHSLRSPYIEDQQEPVWSDIVYGSVIQLQSESQPPMYVHSPFKHWPKGSKQIQVAAYEYPDLSNHWIIIRANMSHEREGKGNEEKVLSEIPERIQRLHHGDWIRLRHVAHRHCLHSHDVRTMGRAKKKRHCEISAYGLAGNDFDGDHGDWWRVEAVNTDTMRTVPKKVEGLRVKALETAFRLRQHAHNCHLHLTGDLLDDSVPGGEGRVELSCLKNAAVLTSSIWRFSMNDHDYLPAETELASYPKVSFLKKFKEIHNLIGKKPRAFEMNKAAVDDRTESSRPLSWLLLPTGSPTLLTWRSKVTEFEEGDKGHVRQISLVPNPASWVIRTFGLVLFVGFHLLSVLRYQRGYFDGQDVATFRQRHLSGAGTFFTAWALHFLPLILLKSSPSIRLSYRDYFPALYFSVLLSCTLLSGIMHLSTMPRLTRAGMYLSLTIIAFLAFILLSPLTYGTLMTPDQCTSLATRINPAKIPDPGYAGVAKGTHIPLIQPTLKLDCATWAQHLAQTQLSPTNQPSSETFAQFKDRTELHLTKPIPRKRSPVLEPIFPDKDEVLPKANVFMTPCQRPPQLWDVNEQEGKPNAFQKQQMQYIFRKIEKDAKEEAERRKKLEEEEVAEAKKQRIEAEVKEQERVRVEKERVEKERQEKDKLDREIEAKSAAEEEERQYQIKQKALVAEQARRERIETEKQQKVQEIADHLRKEAEKKEAARKAQQEHEEAKRQRLNRQNTAFYAAAKAAEVAAASKAAEKVIKSEVDTQKEKEARELEQTKVKAAERAERVAAMPSRQEFHEMFFKRAEKVRQAKVNEGFQFENDGVYNTIPSELRVLNAVLSATRQMGGGGVGGGRGDIAELEALSEMFARFSDLSTQGLGQQQQQDLLKQKVGTGSAATKPVKKTPPKSAKKAPVGNVENLESLIEALQQAQKKAPTKPKAAPAPQQQQQPEMTQELLDQVAKLEQLSNGKTSPEELLEQLGGLVNVMAKQQVKLGIQPEDLANLQESLVNLLGIVKEQEEVEKIQTKRKW